MWSLYFFSPIFFSLKDILLKDHAEVDGDVMMRAFQRSAKAKPLHRSNLVGFKVKFSKADEPLFFLLSYLNIYFIFLLVQLYFPSFYEDHWFVFVVDIKDRKFVFLDSFYSELHAYQQYVREKMVCFVSPALLFFFVFLIKCFDDLFIFSVLDSRILILVGQICQDWYEVQWIWYYISKCAQAVSR